MSEKLRISKTLGRILKTKLISQISIFLNIISILAGIFYLIIRAYNILWEIYGVIFLITIFWNILMIYTINLKINRVNNLGRILNKLSYYYLLFLILAMIFIMLANLLISIRYSNKNLGIFIFVYSWYFGIFVFGLIFAQLCYKYQGNTLLHESKGKENDELKPKALKFKHYTKKILRVISWFFFIIGIYLGFVIVYGCYIDILVIPTILAGQFGIFFSIIFLSNTLILLKLKSRKRSLKKHKIIGLLGLIFSFFLLIPLMATPFSYYMAEKNFTDAFGADYDEKIPNDIKDKYFLRSPFILPEYFLGSSPKDCIVKRDVKFYEGSNLKLYFDVYMPREDPKNLPGEGSILIRLHGGGWVMLDKGETNMLQMNKYFAAQGYIVFDVQYAQYDIGYSLPNTPDYLLGDFTIDEIVFSLGYFTKYLIAHADEYNANLDSVFISGGSAGGHLTCALALGIASGKYKDQFGSNLTIKGLIPFYPANGMMKYFGIKVEDKNLANPENLIDKNSPPCLIFQGTHDILNTWFHIAEKIKQKYNAAENEKCAIIWMPAGGHACDVYFTGYYNMLFLYYMERFLYIYH